MVISLLYMAAAVSVLLVASDVMGASDLFNGAFCSAPDNLPCRPLTLECLMAGAGGLAAGLPAIPPEGSRQQYEQPSTEPDRTPREYAPTPAPGSTPAPRQSPQDAINDPEFRRAREDWARENADRVYPTGPPADNTGRNAARVFMDSIRAQAARQ